MSLHGQAMVHESRLADAYYARVCELTPQIRARLSLEMLREIFDRMVVPAVREVDSPRPTHDFDAELQRERDAYKKALEDIVDRYPQRAMMLPFIVVAKTLLSSHNGDSNEQG